MTPATEFIDGSFWRTARKAHPCRGCGPASNRHHAPLCPGDINPGDRYVEYLGEAPAYAGGNRYSVWCADAALKVTQ